MPLVSTGCRSPCRDFVSLAQPAALDGDAAAHRVLLASAFDSTPGAPIGGSGASSRRTRAQDVRQEQRCDQQQQQHEHRRRCRAHDRASLTPPCPPNGRVSRPRRRDGCLSRLARPLSAAQPVEGLPLRTSPIAEMSTPADGQASPVGGLGIDKKMTHGHNQIGRG
jgi:hypothetical protein